MSNNEVGELSNLEVPIETAGSDFLTVKLQLFFLANREYMQT